jgi:MFS family permease
MELAAMPDRRSFTALMAANAVSQVGNMMTAVAVPWLVLETTGSVALVGVTGAAIAIGWVVPAILGGPLVDRLGLRRVSVVSDMASCAVVVAIPILQLLDVLAFWQMVLLVLLLSSFNAQGQTSRFALIPGLASRAALSLERANSADRAIARAGQLIGPVLAGVLIAVIGPSNVLFVDAATFALSALLIAVCIPAAASVRSEADPPRSSSYRAELSQGLRFVASNRLLLPMMLLALVGNAFDVPLLTVVLPVSADEIFGSPTSLGLMLGSFAGGAMIGTILFGAIGGVLPRRRLFLSGWLLAVVISYGALAAQVPLAAIVLAGLIGGLVAGPINPILETVVQENTPPELMGRVFGLFIALAQAGIPFGAAVAGVVIEGAGLIPTIATVGAVYAVIVGLMFFNPALRRMDARPAASHAPTPAEGSPAEASTLARSSATMKAGL